MTDTSGVGITEGRLSKLMSESRLMPIALIFMMWKIWGFYLLVQFVHVMWLRVKWVPALFEAHITDSCSVHLELGK